MYYLDKIRKMVTHPLCVELCSMTVPNQAYSPRQILEQWVRNDVEVVSHEPSDTFHSTGDVVKDTNLREFEDDFEVMEYVAERKGRPVTIDDIDGVPQSEGTPESSVSSADPGSPSAHPGSPSAHPGSPSADQP